MVLGRTRCVALSGINGDLVDVEADISGGLPSFVLIGLPDAALAEARDRVRASAQNSGCPLTGKKLTVNLSPAAVPKQGSGFDLAIAIAALAAAGDIDRASTERWVHLGELALDGRVRPVAGILPSVSAAVAAGAHRVVVPAANAHEASLVSGAEVFAAASLRDVVNLHGGSVEPFTGAAVMVAAVPTPAEVAIDLGDVVGNSHAIDALVVAAAGAHHMFLVGPPGAGKTLLAERLPGILPDLDDVESLLVTSVRSLERPVQQLERRPPFEAPHHATGPVAMLGGGSGRIRPGAAVRAAHGVLFLDEAPEFTPATLDTLRQPLESGTVTVHRVAGVTRFPARFQLILAANPCPCGQWGAPGASCSCSPQLRRRYLGRISGPLLDRVDIRLRVERVTATQLALAQDAAHLGHDGAATAPRTTAEARQLVDSARRRAILRLRGTPWRRNAHASGAWLRHPDRLLPARDRAVIDQALEDGALSMRGYDRVLRLAWTCADLEGAVMPTAAHVRRALALRRAAL